MKLPFTRSWYIFGLAILAFLAALTWANAVFLVPNFITRSTFLGPYAAARAFVTEGLNPYSDEAARKAASLMRRATGSRDPRPPELTIPFYGILLYVPFGFIPDVNIALAAWITFLELIAAAIPYLVWKLANWDAPPWVLAVFWSTSLLSIFTLQPLLTGNIIVLVIFLLLCGTLALIHQYEEAAGILLAFAAIKPVFSWLVLFFLFWWAYHQRRWQFFFWYVSNLVIFFALSFILVPDWLLQYLRSIYHALELSPVRFNLVVALSGARAGEARLLWILFGAFVILFLWECARAHYAEGRRLLWVLSLTIALSQLINLENSREYLLLLTLPGVVIMMTFAERLGQRGPLIVAGAMAVFFVSVWLLVSIPVLMQGGSALDVLTNIPPWFSIWLPTLTLAGLYWIRWWIHHPLTSTTGTWPARPRQ